MISYWVHSPENVIQTICHRGQRHARTQIASGKHPVNLPPSQTAVMEIFEQICLVIPIDKAISQGGKKNHDCHEGDDRRCDSEKKPRLDPSALGNDPRSSLFSATSQLFLLLGLCGHR